MNESSNPHPVTLAATDAGAATKRDLSVSLVAANVKSLIFGLPPVGLFGGFYLLIWGMPRVAPARGWLFPFLAYCLAGIIAHEAIHGLAWVMFGTKSFSTIRFGINLKALTPYAHVTVPMKAGAYRLGAAAPAVLLGVLPSVCGIILGNALMTLLGMIFTAAAGGDLLVLWLIRHVPAGAMVEDHPTNAGCFVFEDETKPDALMPGG
jgi:hypothetical protein